MEEVENGSVVRATAMGLAMVAVLCFGGYAASGALVLCASAANAQTDAEGRGHPAVASSVPSSSEIAALMPKIKELTQDDFTALKSKKKTNAETADALLSYISDGDEPAAKFIIRQMAFRQYVLGSAFDKADKLYTSARSEYGVEYALALAAPSRQKMFKAAARELKDRIIADDKSSKGISAIKSKLAKTPGDAKLHEQLGMEYVACGDWESALRAFRSGNGDIAKIAAWELSDEKGGDYNAAKVAGFWWTLAEGEKNRQAADIVKLHAADWYKKAVALNLLTGLDAKIANRRIEEVESSEAQTLVKERTEKGLYMIVDLTKVGKRAVSYLDETPKGGWSDDYRTKKMAFRRIDPGSFEYMPGKSFKITKPFYIGVFEVTQKQYEMTMKTNPSEFKGDMRPVGNVRYIDIRGKNKGFGWPKDSKVDDDSYLGKLRKRIGLEFDLPTEVQWEYSCRAGTKGDYNIDGIEMTKLGKCKENGGLNDHHVKVGSFLPNAWGLYDMHGNVWEFCLDRGKDFFGWVWFDWNSEPKETDTDPRGPATGASRILRGGDAASTPPLCRSSSRCRVDSGIAGGLAGFRLVCPAETAK